LDLPTHFFFGLAIGFVFFGHQPEFALLVGIGALLPDLDREYWFIPAKTYAAEQRHRALFHNVVVIAISFVVSPFLSLGVFLHVLQDSFTTVKDRGVEWFYPFTRLAKRGRYDANGDEQAIDPKEKVYFYQEDPPGLVKYADADLQETLDKPIPWRRVYGFALNGQLLDRGFLFGSIAVLLVWVLVPDSSGTLVNLSVLRGTQIHTYELWVLGLVAVGTLFFAGELDRRDRVRPTLERFKVAKIPLFALGLALFSGWICLEENSFVSNALVAVSQPLQIAAVAVLIPVISFILVREQTKKGRQPATI